MLRLNDSLAAFKEKQAECFANLPRPELYKEDPAYAACHSLDDILACRHKSDIDDDEDANNTSSVSILRSAIEELSRSRDDMEGVTTEDLFTHLEAKLPWLKGEQGAKCQVSTPSVLDVTHLYRRTERPLANSQRLPLVHIRPAKIFFFYHRPSFSPPLDICPPAHIPSSTPRRRSRHFASRASP